MRNIFKILITTVLLFVALSLRGQTLAKRDTVLTGRIEFVVNTTNIIENDSYRHFTDTLMPFVKANKDRVIKAIIVGSASPEGKVSRNLYLAKVRAMRMLPLVEDVIDRDKIHIISSSDLFLQISRCDENNWNARRGTYLEVWMRGTNAVDTIRKEKHDTIYIRERIVDRQIDTIDRPFRRIPILGVKTNLLADALITPNVQAELYTHLWGLSLEFDYTFPWYHKDYDKYFYYQLLNGIAGIRKYLNNNYTGHYFGVYANTAIYDICPFDKDLGWQGEVYGAGVSYGYVFQNKKHPRVKFEPYIRLGWFNNRFDTYHASQPWDEKYYYNWYQRASDFVPRRLKMDYFGPTEIGFNFTFDIVCLRKY